ncbi:permease-like cell division protein FtsX [Oscillospiraceae bacterium PP1C4]
MKGSSFGYLLKEGAKNVYVNRLMSFASIGTLVACMLLIGSSLLLSMNVNQVVGFVEQQNEIVAFIKDDVTDEELADIDAQIAQIDNIYETMYLDKEAVLKEQQVTLGESALLLDGLEGDQNPYPPTYRMKIRDLSQLTTTVMKLKAVEGVLNVIAPDGVAEVVTSLKRAVSVSGMFIVGILLVVSLVIIGNTIKVTVFNRRKEINIMKYVGATDSFIRLPFFVEGFLLGLLSALIAFGLLWAGYNYVMQVISQNESMWIVQAYQNMIPFENVQLKLLCWFTGGGISIGVCGSMFFVNRYLKV